MQSNDAFPQWIEEIFGHFILATRWRLYAMIGSQDFWIPNKTKNIYPVVYLLTTSEDLLVFEWPFIEMQSLNSLPKRHS